MKSEKDIKFSLFENLLLQVLNAYALIKFKGLTAIIIWKKVLRKAIMHRSGLKIVFNKNGTRKTYDSYKKQRNICVNR